MTRRRFSRKLKIEAARLVTDRGVAVALAARDPDVAEYISGLRNPRPRHSALGGKSPASSKGRVAQARVRCGTNTRPVLERRRKAEGHSPRGNSLCWLNATTVAVSTLVRIADRGSLGPVKGSRPSGACALLHPPSGLAPDPGSSSPAQRAIIVLRI